MLLSRLTRYTQPAPLRALKIAALTTLVAFGLGMLDAIRAEATADLEETQEELRAAEARLAAVMEAEEERRAVRAPMVPEQREAGDVDA